MKALNILKENKIVIAAAFVLAAVITGLNFHKLGVKDSGMLFFATVLLVISLFLVFRDIKKSILLFIVSFPVLVTARKAVYFDIAFLKVTYESVYVLTAFIHSFKEIAGLVRKAYENRNRLDLNLFIYIAVLLIFALNSSIFSGNILPGISHTFISIAIPIMFGLVILGAFYGDSTKPLQYAMVIMADFSCLYGFFQVVSNRISFSRLGAMRHLITFGYHNVNIFAGIVILIIPFVLERILYREKSTKEWIFLAASFILCSAGLFITFTRGAWITLIISFFIVLLSRKYRYFIYGFGALFLIGIKPLGGYILRRGTSTSLMANESTIARLQSIFTSLVIMKKYPFGAGSGTFAEMYKKYVTEGYLMMPYDFRTKIRVATYNMEAAHNLWLQIGTELGIVCLAAFFLIFLNRLIKTLKNFRNMKAELAALVSFFIYSFLTGVEFEHKGVITGTLVIWMIFMMIEIKDGESGKFEKLD